jgi:DNA polymerase-3 subunit delta'
MWPVIGHAPALARLKRSLQNGTLGHAYLVSGPPGAGKMTLALALAQALNCQSGEAPCGVCSVCQRISSSSHPDVQVVALGSSSWDEEGRSKTEISIKQVRDDIQHWASLPPFEGGYRVFIIGEAELLSSEAANCLLKTLEEPQQKVLFMLLTGDPGRLPETVISRCQRLDLKPVAAELVEKSLAERGAPPEKARLLGRLCRGRPGWALRALEDESLLERRAERIERLTDVIGGDLEVRFEYAGELAARFSQKRAEVQEILEEWLDLWRDMLLIKSGQAELVINLDYVARLQMLSDGFNISNIRSGISAIMLAQKQLRQNASPRLVLEVVMLDMPAAQNKRVESRGR